jgi:hypothetical protein
MQGCLGVQRTFCWVYLDALHPVFFRTRPSLLLLLVESHYDTRQHSLQQAHRQTLTFLLDPYLGRQILPTKLLLLEQLRHSVEVALSFLIILKGKVTASCDEVVRCMTPTKRW